MGLFDGHRQMLRHVQPARVTGRVSGVRGLTVTVSDFPAPVGAACRIVRGRRGVDARVVGFAEEQTLVMPLGAVEGVCRGDRVQCATAETTVAAGDEMLGRVLDGFARPIDGRGELHGGRRMEVWPEPIAPMRRRRISERLPTGVRALDAFLTVGRGQRMGVFSGSGVGKSMLLGMIGRHSRADVNVIALVGERGREVRDFLERDLGEAGLRRSVVVVATSDEPPLVRVQAAAVATAVAEGFRDDGRDVLLMMDSLTRLATAQRQIGLAAGEPPTSRGYPPSTFNLLPRLLERAGRTESGSITAFYTVLVEGDDPAEPVCDAVRAIADGHVWLSRPLAQRGQYPAVDVLQSVSRVRNDVTEPRVRAAADELRNLLALYAEVEDLVNVGAYKNGANADYDRAIQAVGEIRDLLAQPVERAADYDETAARVVELAERFGRGRETPAA
ncbi:MAG TPA: EscN/YscN/HrcN family type III secretion system ATPase [Phycisphaerales bacterium]|nr:EscN/YscN/HrcN family type III secretion system ATPase [Phycisphaerales bacterium]